jgi:hypothetical protein
VVIGKACVIVDSDMARNLAPAATVRHP